MGYSIVSINFRVRCQVTDLDVVSEVMLHVRPRHCQVVVVQTLPSLSVRTFKVYNVDELVRPWHRYRSDEIYLRGYDFVVYLRMT